MEEVINATTKKSVAGKHIATMSATERDDVVTKLSKTAKINEKKHVKAAVLGVSYDNLCKLAFLGHLQGLQGPVATMVHAKRKTLADEQGLFAQIKIGDWVEVEPDYSPVICSDGGVACVLGLHTEICNVVGGNVANIITAVDVHFLVFNTKERRVLLSRVVVIPMPYKMQKPTLRARKISNSTKIVLHKAATAKQNIVGMAEVRVGNETARKARMAVAGTRAPSKENQRNQSKGTLQLLHLRNILALRL
jgi:hypothetical protein